MMSRRAAVTRVCGGAAGRWLLSASLRGSESARVFARALTMHLAKAAKGCRLIGESIEVVVFI
jgi:hypothetical protein